MDDMYKEIRCSWGVEERGLEGRWSKEGRLNERGQAAGIQGEPRSMSKMTGVPIIPTSPSPRPAAGAASAAAAARTGGRTAEHMAGGPQRGAAAVKYRRCIVVKYRRYSAVECRCSRRGPLDCGTSHPIDLLLQSE